ncbi:MAG: hypothetical protein IJT19_08445, partial [Bacteroidaceae bacterium]|nr:hypothetical protein [Bacteroidaceae bacterium]
MKTTNFILSLAAMLMSIVLPGRLAAQNVVPQIGDKLTTQEQINTAAEALRTAIATYQQGAVKAFEVG